MRKLIPTLVSLAFFGTAQLAALDLSLACEPYADSGLYNRPLLPNEGDKVTFGVQCSVDGKPEAAIECEINLADADGETVHKERKELALGEGTAGVEFQWVAASNGLYKLRAVLDPDNKLAETNEDNNTAEIQLPVIVKGRRLFFAWYRYSQWTRWANVATSVGDDAPDLARRGIIPLAWEYGGKSWDKFDNSRFDAEPEAAMKELQETFYKKFAWRELGSHAGVGIDETGGYPGTHSEMRSIASMRGLVQAKKERPERFFAVWHGGGVRNPVAGLYRRGADLLRIGIQAIRVNVPVGLCSRCESHNRVGFNSYAGKPQFLALYKASSGPAEGVQYAVSLAQAESLHVPTYEMRWIR